MPNKKQPPLYALGSIPNNEEGLNFIKLMKTFLNKDRYEIDVRGQHKKDGIHWSECPYHVRMDQAKTLRVYIKDKVEDQHPLHVIEKKIEDQTVFFKGMEAGIKGCIESMEAHLYESQITDHENLKDWNN